MYRSSVDFQAITQGIWPRHGALRDHSQIQPCSRLPAVMILILCAWGISITFPGVGSARALGPVANSGLIATYQGADSKQLKGDEPRKDTEEGTNESDQPVERSIKSTTETKEAPSNNQQDSSDTTEAAESVDKPEAPPNESTSTKDDHAPDTNDSTESKKPKTLEVKRKSLTIEKKLDGLFVAKETKEVAIQPETWSRFTVLETVEHGANVKKGDVLVRFDDEQIEDRIEQDAIDQRLEELSLMQSQEQLPREERLLELAYEAAKRRYDRLVEDQHYYEETDRPFAERIAKYYYDSAREDLASQEEELAQLKKMYEADELTEDTEEIVLRRQEFEVSTAKLMLELQEANRDYTLNVTLPRNDVNYAAQLEEARLKLEDAKTARELGVTRDKYELEKRRVSREKSVQDGAKLLNDRNLMELRAPMDGTVYYGRCKNGRWSEISTLSSKLVPQGTVPPHTVLMTIVQQRPLYVRTDLSEKEVTDFSTGMKAVILPTADEDEDIGGHVKSVGTIPDSSRKFEMQIELGDADLPEWLVAGMTCSLKVTTYRNENALQIPKSAVQTDDEDPKVKYVSLLKEKEAKPVRREVKLGHTQGKYVEVLSGLEEGDSIISEPEKPGQDDKEDKKE